MKWSPNIEVNGSIGSKCRNPKLSIAWSIRQQEGRVCLSFHNETFTMKEKEMDCNLTSYTGSSISSNNNKTRSSNQTLVLLSLLFLILFYCSYCTTISLQSDSNSRSTTEVELKEHFYGSLRHYYNYYYKTTTNQRQQQPDFFLFQSVEGTATVALSSFVSVSSNQKKNVNNNNNNNKNILLSWKATTKVISLGDKSPNKRQYPKLYNVPYFGCNNKYNRVLYAVSSSSESSSSESTASGKESEIDDASHNKNDRNSNEKVVTDDSIIIQQQEQLQQKQQRTDNKYGNNRMGYNRYNNNNNNNNKNSNYNNYSNSNRSNSSDRNRFNDNKKSNWRKPVDSTEISNNKRSSSHERTSNRNQIQWTYKKINEELVASETNRDLLQILQKVQTIPNYQQPSQRLPPPLPKQKLEGTKNSPALTQRAGGGVLNSVNFSTAIHRLARRSASSKVDRASTLTDPRFALFLASLAEALASSTLARSTSNTVVFDKISQPTTVVTFQSRELSNVAWALAKLQVAPPASVMPMPEMMVTKINKSVEDTSSFIVDKDSGNEQQPQIQEQLQQHQHQLKVECAAQLIKTSQLVRQSVYDVALGRQRSTSTDFKDDNSSELEEEEEDPISESGVTESTGSTISGISNKPWIPLISQLSGHILDYIGAVLLIEVEQPEHQQQQMTTIKRSDKSKLKPFRIQEYANMLWAWATAGRASSTVFGIVVRAMIQQQRVQQNEEKNNEGIISTIAPQEWSNSIWAFATAQIYDGHEELLYFVAELLLKHEYFIHTFKSQELSNTAWGVATLLSNKHHNIHQHRVVSSVSSKSKDVGSTPMHASSASATALSSTSVSQLPSLLTTAEQQASLTIVRQIASSIVTRNAMDFRTQELSNTAWAFATVGFGLVPTSEQSLNNYVILLSDQQRDDTKLMKQAINVIIAAAIPLLTKFRSQELNNLTWTLARLMSGCAITPVNGNNGMIEASSDLTPTAVSMLKTLLRMIGMQLSDRRRLVTSQDIGTTLWGFATLGYFDETIYRGIATRLTPDSAHNYKPQELSNTLWAFATAEIDVADKDIFDTTLVFTKSTSIYSSRSTSMRQQQQPQQRPKQSQALSSSDPITRCFAIAAQELMRRPGQFKSQEIKDVLWSFSKVGIRHPSLFQSVALHLAGQGDNSNDDDRNEGNSIHPTNIFRRVDFEKARGLDEFSPQGLGNSAWAYARQAQLSEDVTTRLNGQSTLSSSNGRLAVYTTIFCDIGEALLKRLFHKIADTDIRVHDNLRRCKPQDLANTCWSFAVLGMKHTALLNAAKIELIQRTSRYVRGDTSAMTTFKGQELANLVWSLATLNASGADVLDYISPYLWKMCQNSQTGKVTPQSIARFVKRQELANLAWACAVFGRYPRELMELIYMGLVGSGSDQNPTYMSSIHDDGGLQLQAIMTLFYVQAVMDLEGANHGLKLPDRFPDGWQQESPIRSDTDGDILIPKSFGLNLSTSKIQRSVSTAFNRIGFRHVEEHTITAKELASEHNISLRPTSIEILSIDIANVDNKIAIEVDGPAHFISSIDSIVSSPSGYSKISNGKIEYQFEWSGVDQDFNGPTYLKERLLKSLGWNVVHVPFWEWYSLGGDATREEEYCRSVLARVRTS